MKTLSKCLWIFAILLFPDAASAAQNWERLSSNEIEANLGLEHLHDLDFRLAYVAVPMLKSARDKACLLVDCRKIKGRDAQPSVLLVPLAKNTSVAGFIKALLKEKEMQHASAPWLVLVQRNRTLQGPASSFTSEAWNTEYFEPGDIIGLMTVHLDGLIRREADQKGQQRSFMRG